MKSVKSGLNIIFILLLGSVKLQAEALKLQPYTGPTEIDWKVQKANEKEEAAENSESTEAGSIESNVNSTQVYPAKVTIGNQTFGLRPNPEGVFPQIRIEAQGVIVVQVKVRGQSVEVRALHGGLIDGDSKQTIKKDGTGLINFTFNAPKTLGKCQVSILDKGKTRTLNFWIGPELPKKVNKKSE